MGKYKGDIQAATSTDIELDTRRTKGKDEPWRDWIEKTMAEVLPNSGICESGGRKALDESRLET